MARTKEFDEDAVLLKAMLLFWEQGYEKTSMQDLVTCMGIHKGSLYDTFGDKHSLYIKALKKYIDMFDQVVKRPVMRRMADTNSAKESIRFILELIVQPESGIPDGCFMVNTATELAKQDPISRDLVLLGWANFEQFLREIIEEGQQSGEISKTLNAEFLSYYFNNTLIGLRVLVKAISEKEKFEHIINMNLSVLD